MRKLSLISLILTIALSACSRTARVIIQTPLPYTLVPTINQVAPVPFEAYVYATRVPGSPILTPTPDGAAGPFPTMTPMGAALASAGSAGPQEYTVVAGDIPASIAEQFGISTADLLAANDMSEDSIIYPGDTLKIPSSGGSSPAANTGFSGAPANTSYFKIIPDSELVNGPLAAQFDLEAFINQKGGYLASYTQDADGETLTGAQIVRRVALDYSINPRALLALLEYQTGWVTNPNPASAGSYVPITYVDDFHEGLYRQLTWSAAKLNEGFYGWKEKKLTSYSLPDGTTMVPNPGINAGTAAIMNLFAFFDNADQWQTDTGESGYYASFNALFGYPFDLSIDPLVPKGLSQPALALPFQAGVTWQFTGGPHAGWDVGSAWAALDFAPPGEPVGCAPVDPWVVAMAPGLIVRSSNGAVVEDLDGDGLEETGWTILYMHMATDGRVAEGTRVAAGDLIGHPSCEGGLAEADHLHLARRYNGVWIPADDPSVPFVLGGFVTSGGSVEYDGLLTGHGKVVEAFNGSNPGNQIP